MNIEKAFSQAVDSLVDYIYFCNPDNTGLVNFKETIGMIMCRLGVGLEDEYRQ